MRYRTILETTNGHARITTDDPAVKEQLEGIPEARVLEGGAAFELPAKAARVHFPHLHDGGPERDAA